MKEEPMDIESIDQEEEEIDIEFTDECESDGKVNAVETEGKMPKLVCLGVQI